MGEDTPHMGIFYSIHSVGAERWRWEIRPPTCVKGLRAESGVVEGQRLEAVIAARKAIEIQTAHFQRRGAVEFLDLAERPGFEAAMAVSGSRAMS